MTNLSSDVVRPKILGASVGVDVHVKDRFVLSASGVLLAKISTGAFQVLYTYAFAWVLAANDFATFLLLVSAATFLGAINTAGAADACVRFVGVAAAAHDPLTVRSSAYDALALVTIVATGVGVLIIAAASVAHVLKIPFILQDELPVILTVSIGYAYRSVAAGVLRGLGHLAAAAIFEGTLFNALISVPALIAVAGGARLSLLAGTRCLLVASVTAAALAWLAVARSIRTTSDSRRGQRPFELRRLMRVGVPLLVGNLLGQLSGQMIIWYVALLGTSHDVAAYGLGWQLFQVVNLVAMVGQSSAAPRAAGLWAQQQRSAIATFARETAWMISVGTGATLVALIVVVGCLHSAISLPYVKVSLIIASLLSVGRLACQICGVTSTLLAMTGGERSVQIISILSTGATVLLTPLAFAIGGAIGAGAAGGAYFAAYGILGARAVHDHLGFWPVAQLPRSWWKRSLSLS